LLNKQRAKKKGKDALRGTTTNVTDEQRPLLLTSEAWMVCFMKIWWIFVELTWSHCFGIMVHWWSYGDLMLLMLNKP